MYKVQEENKSFYIKKRFLFWWYKVPDHGLGWGIKSMAFIKGHDSKELAQMTIDKHYEKQNL